MGIKLCPHCKLNYVKPGNTYCKVCMDEFKDIDDIEDTSVVCPVCAVNIILDGSDICEDCLEKRIKMSGYIMEDGNVSDAAESDGDDLDGMRLVDLENDAPDDVKEEFI